MRYRFIDQHRAVWPLVAMAKVLEVSRQGYHAWKRREPAERTLRMRERTRQIKRVYAESNGSYGSPRVTLVLRKAGDVVAIVQQRIHPRRLLLHQTVYSDHSQ